jgi:hypothetical protein
MRAALGFIAAARAAIASATRADGIGARPANVADSVKATETQPLQATQ